MSALTELDAGLPGAAGAAQRGALVDLAFLADDLADARELVRQARVQLDDVVERVGDLAGDAGCARPAGAR